MATKKRATAPQVEAPSFLAAADESNKTVARAKAALAKKWSVTRPETLADATQLGWFLVALKRENEARELADHIFEGMGSSMDTGAWSAAAPAIALAARIARQRDDTARSRALVDALVKRPAIAASPREAFLKSLSEAEKDVRSAEVESSPKWACQFFARGCARAAYFRELAPEGVYEAGALDIDGLEATIAEGVTGLRAFLTR